VENEKIGMRAARADRHVVPAEVVVLQEPFQPLRDAPLAGGHAAECTAEAGDQLCHLAFRSPVLEVPYSDIAATTWRENSFEYSQRDAYRPTKHIVSPL
jgi:hypothetical protein